MSIVEELGAQVRAAADELPVALVTEALDRLRQAADRLRWVRQESADPMGVPELSAATEHAETAGHTLRVAQDQFAAYLAAIGLAGDGPPAAGQPQRREPADDQPTAGPGPVPEPQGEAGPVHRWWSVRVTELTGQRDSPEAKPDREITDAEDLLRRVAERVRADDRGQLHAQLRDVPADVGLGMAAVAPPMLRDLAAELLGHPPRAQDLPRLRGELTGKARDLLPGLPAEVLETALSRVCRMPPPKNPTAPPHPADPAVAAGVLTGLLLNRLGRDARSVAAQNLRESDG
ncbi:hypothetical protein [Micromonospora sp. NBC_01796]|uniref:hypothetical protein n=1 Tax=Micromonospora sp. NBC_01796 TaxID=2975987 RepID=UPI002DD9BA51|nr:hypothetical protein [Micromonospora sp. NBC_01796]WSA85319.1 hypothetical protein OIE47_34030 [Micromonospora sp. NBC_01796]